MAHRFTNHPQDVPHTAANVMHIASQEKLIKFYHWILGAPAISTLLAAIDNSYLYSFLGLTATLVIKYYPNPMATSKGHLDQTRKNQRSTKLQVTSVIEDTTPPDDANDSAPQVAAPTKEVYVAAFSNSDIQPTGHTYMEGTG